MIEPLKAKNKALQLLGKKQNIFLQQAKIIFKKIENAHLVVMEKISIDCSKGK